MINNVYFLGPKGSYSYKIIQKVDAARNAVGCTNFAQIVKNVIDDKDSIGVLPIENSITSNVHENMDFLFKENLKVVAEGYLNIRLCLIGLKDARTHDVKKVYSHPQAIAQCKKFILKHNYLISETDSTAAAKDLILDSGDTSNAVIGDSILADDSRLAIINENIGDEKFNITRFIFVASNFGDRNILINLSSINNKASIMFTIPHKPGSLAKLLTQFAVSNINLAKIESRPIPATNWEFQFWVDIENEPDREIDGKILADILKKNTKSYKIIGIYPSGKIYD